MRGGLTHFFDRAAAFAIVIIWLFVLYIAASSTEHL